MNFPMPEEDGLVDGRYPQSRYDALVASVAAKYSLREWLARCRRKELAAPLQEAFDETAGILEYEQGLSKEVAEERAATIVFAKFNIL